MRPVRTITSAALPLLLLAGVAGLVLAPSAGAVGAAGLHAGGDEDAGGDDDAGAVAALRRAVLTGLTASFEGTQVTTARTAAGSSTLVLDVIQRDGQRWTHERDAVGSSGPGVQARVGPGSSPAAETVLALLVRGYRLSAAGRERAAGRLADIVIATRAGRQAARWWLDVRTGLVLRQEVYDRHGQLRRMSAFLDVNPLSAGALRREVLIRDAGLQVAPNPGNPGNPATPATPTAAPAAAPSSSAAMLSWPARWAGVDVPRTLPGGLELVDARQPAGGTERGVLHLTYTDGLCGVSLFVQRGRLDAAELAGYQAQQWGASAVHVAGSWPVRVVWQRGDSVLTLVADADQDEVRSIVDAMPAEARQDGMLAAALSGLDTVVRWLRH